MSSKSYTRAAEAAVAKMPKVSGELFALTYGSLVSQLLKDLGDVEKVNEKLEQMGYNIGVRLIEEFLALSDCRSCEDFRMTCEVLSKYALKVFLGISGEVVNSSSDNSEVQIELPENPFVYFVEIPPQYKGLKYSNLLCGVIRGSLEMVMMEVRVSFVEDRLQGGSRWLLKLELLKRLEAVAGDDYDEP